jgi:hypothetical protein
MSSIIRIEMVMPSLELAHKKFPEAEATFKGGISGLALKAAGLKPSIFLEGLTVVVEIDCKTEAGARQLLPMFEKQALAATAKEEREKGSCIDMRVFLKEDK